MNDFELKNFVPEQRDLILVALQEASKQRALNESDLINIARHFNVSPAKVYGIATFYSFIPIKRIGKNVIKVCKSVSCDLAEKDEILSTIKNLLKIDIGETSSDGLFTLIETNCIGWCDEAPAVLINDTPYTKLTPEKISEILIKIKKDN
jgi:NADH:ubiquinone oxidoreductase subunit E